MLIKHFILGAQVCTCKTAEKSEKKPLMVDKNLETDRELTTDFELEMEPPNNNFEISKHENVLIDLIEQKRAADRTDKVRENISRLL